LVSSNFSLESRKLSAVQLLHIDEVIIDTIEANILVSCPETNVRFLGFNVFPPLGDVLPG